MKGIVPITILLALLGCAAKAGYNPPYDTRAADYRRVIMIQCGEIATTLSEGDPVLADKLYGMCLFDQNLTI